MIIKLLVFLLIFVFVFLKSSLNNLEVLAFVFCFLLVLTKEIFTYLYGYKILVNTAFYTKNSFIKKILSGKIITSIFSFFLAFILVFSFVMNILDLKNTDFIFVFLIIPFLFILIRFVFLKVFKNELKNLVISKKIIILISAFVAVLLFFAFNLYAHEDVFIDKNFFEYLSSLDIQSNYNSSILNELFTYNFYLHEASKYAQNTIFSKYNILILFFISLNNFLFFTAILHFSSYFLEKTSKSYFINTIFTLFYATMIFMFAFYFNKINISHEANQTMTKRVFEFVLQNGAKFNLELLEGEKLLDDLNESKNKYMNATLSSLNSYIDDSFEIFAKKISKKMSDFQYSVFSDYLILWHGAVDRNATKFLHDKFSSFVNETFPNDFNKNIEEIVMLGFDKYEDNVSFQIKQNSNFDMNLNFNLDNFKYRINATNISTGVFSAALITKILIKSLSKTGAKIGASSVGAESGVVCGVGAVVCIPAFAVATWFGFDYIFAKGDEFLNKENYEKEIYNEIMLSKNELKNTINNDIKNAFFKAHESIFKDIKIH